MFMTLADLATIRSHFGNTTGDWLLKPYRMGRSTLVALGDETTVLKFYSAKTGGTQYTDLLDENGTAATSITVTGYQVPRFQGPVGIVGMWADKGDGSPREFMEAQDLAAAAAAVAAAAASADAAAAATTTKVDKTALVASGVAPAPTVSPFSAVGNGVTDDTSAFTAFQAVYSGYDVDLRGRTHKVTVIPTGNRYFNGTWRVGAVDSPTVWDPRPRTGNGRVAMGASALSALDPGYAAVAAIAIGKSAMESMTSCRNSVAIGVNAMRHSTQARDDIAIGDSALREIQSGDDDYTQADLTGTRMVALGGNAGLFAVSNYNEVLIGRNASQCKTSGNGLVAIGANAQAGHAQYGLATPTDGGDIINNQAWGSSAFCRTVAIGSSALSRGMSLSSVAVGGDALANAKFDDANVAVGAAALSQLGVGTGIKGGTYTTLGTTGTYSQTTTTVTITITTHGLTTGDYAYLQLTTGGSATFGSDQAILAVTVTNANVFTVTSPVSRSATGNVTLVAKETVAAATLNSNNTAVGKDAGAVLQTSSENTFVGKGAGASLTDAGWNVLVGSAAGGALTGGTNNVLVGYQTYGNATGGGGNIGVGTSALRYQMDGSTAQTATINNSTAVGREAVCGGSTAVAVGYQAKASTDGTAVGRGASTGSFSNSVALGNGATGTANNQVTLGNASIATIRAQVTSITALSDERDKVDIVDTPLGLEFVEKLRPVDYRKKPRETGELDPQLRHGFLAQQVLSVMADLGVDFGGVDDSDPDHLAMTYGDLIAPLVRAVQQLSARVAELESTRG